MHGHAIRVALPFCKRLGHQPTIGLKATFGLRTVVTNGDRQDARTPNRKQKCLIVHLFSPTATMIS